LNSQKVIEPAKRQTARDGRQRRSGKRDARKRALAEDAIKALSELGYARTSLRDIANCSGVSVGVLHYYFHDKEDLISFCVRVYKEDFMKRLDSIAASAPDSDSLIRSFSDGLVETLDRGGDVHRLWYDIRSQAMFDEVFQPVVEEIEDALIGVTERVLLRIGALRGCAPAMNAREAYLLLDGQFRYFLQRKLAGDRSASADYRAMLDASFKTQIL